MTVYLFNSYREVIEKQILINKQTRGYKSRLAEAAGCHSSYISQVLSGQVELTLEQGMNLCSYWRLDENETDYFLDLLLLERAGNPRLREFYELKLKRAREVRDVVGGGLPKEKILPGELANIYYSSWHYAAVHVLALTREYSNVERMAGRLRLQPSLVKEALQTLEKLKIISPSGNGWVEASGGIFLPRGAPMSATNHANWRQRAIQNIQIRDPEALHVMHVSTVSRSDIPKFKAKLAECMNELRILCEKSPSEDAVAICIDLFRV